MDAKHDFHLIQVGTVNENMEAELRTVVLRACDQLGKIFSFHTNIQSGKIKGLKRNNAISLHFWDKKNSLQIRIKGEAVLHFQNELSREKLKNLQQAQLELYTQTLAPGTILSESEPSQQQSAAQAFCWVEIVAIQMEILHLGRQGKHTRASFIYENQELKQAHFLQP